MSRSLVLVLALILPDTAMAQSVSAPGKSPDRTIQLMNNAKKLVAVDADGCLINQSRPDEIVVCANADPNRQHRLPFPGLLAPERGQGGVRGEIPAANATVVRTGSCGTNVNDTGCFGERMQQIIGTGNGHGVLGGLAKLVGADSGDVPTGDYGQQFRDNNLSGD